MMKELQTGDESARRSFVKKVLWCLKHRPLNLATAKCNDITPDDLRYGYTRKTGHGLLTSTCFDSDLNSSRQTLMKVFMTEVWPMARTGLKTETGSVGRSDVEEFAEGDLDDGEASVTFSMNTAYSSSVAR